VRTLCQRWLAQTSHLPLSDGAWHYPRRAYTEEPVQGWKIHLSATVLSAEEVFGCVYPILRNRDALFKVPCRLEFLKSLNSGYPDFSQVGKFLTVYPRNDAEAVCLAQELHAATRGLSGPAIPFDVRYRKNSLVFYRYGSFSASSQNGTKAVVFDPQGRPHRDMRDRSHAVPKWARDPFNRRRENPTRPRVPNSIGVDLLPLRALAQRGKGGVYQAVDLSVSPPRLVIIKEGRRCGETDWLGQDGFLRVTREGCLLRELRQRGLPVPEPLREFTERNNRYLVLEKIAGRPLLPRNRLQPATTSWRRAMSLLRQLQPLLDAIHEHGYVWRDCKPEHILVCRGKPWLIDFEGACRISEAGVLPWGSHPYLPPIYRKQFAARRPGTLEDDYALGVILFQFLSGKFPAASARVREAVYKRTRCPNWLRAKIDSLLKF
jgi:hypothetical protein